MNSHGEGSGRQRRAMEGKKWGEMGWKCVEDDEVKEGWREGKGFLKREWM